MIATNHAMRRWAERFPGQDLWLAYARSKRMQFELRQRAVKCCKTREIKNLIDHGGDRYLLYDRESGAVFVMKRPEVVITCWKMPPP